jgi:predicted MPP superfamily phosphohydrolase
MKIPLTPYDLRITIKVLISLVLILLLIFVSKAYYDTNCIEIRRYRIGSPSLGDTLKDVKAAHLSDLHIKTMGMREKKILEVLEEEKPDLIFITGDFIHFKGSYEPVISFLKALKAPLGVFCVLGNTEYSNEKGSCILCHEEKSRSLRKLQNSVFLRNSSAPLRVNGKVLNIIGTDDPVYKRADLKGSFKKVSPDHPSILLAHSPEVFEEASDYGTDLVLSGHNHGGQIFILKYLRETLLLKPSLDFLEGFFQEGRTLMYVSKGLGTSFFPFRLGIKPEIAFFEFSNQTNSISNNPLKTAFTGVSLSNWIETFNVFDLFGLIGLQHGGTLDSPTNSAAAQERGETVAENILFDFESESDLEKLNWECHKWFERSKENATSGQYSLRVILPPGEYPGINFNGVNGDWSKYSYLKLDLFNPTGKEIQIHVRIDDNKSGWKYANRFDIGFELKPGMNHICIPTDSIRTNIRQHPLNLKRIERLMVFSPKNLQQTELYIDYIRLV